MRLISRQKHQHRIKVPPISISQEEILADLVYPARAHPAATTNGARPRPRAR